MPIQVDNNSNLRQIACTSRCKQNFPLLVSPFVHFAKHTLTWRIVA